MDDFSEIQPKLGVLRSRGRVLAYLCAPIIEAETITSEEVLVLDVPNRVRKAVLTCYFEDGKKRRYKIRWDHPQGPATGKGEYDRL